MLNTDTTASTAHKQAASEHQACAEHHTKAAACHDNSKPDEAKASSEHAMKCCDGNQEVSDRLRVFSQVMPLQGAASVPRDCAGDDRCNATSGP